MANLTANSVTNSLGPVLTGLQVPIYAAAKIFQGALVALLTSSGYAVRGGTGSTGAIQGWAAAEAAIPTSSGDVNVNLECGLKVCQNNATHPLDISHVGKVCYASDDQTVGHDSGIGPVAGICTGFQATTGLPIVFIHPSLNYVISQVTLRDDLASVVTAYGASLVGIEDAGSFTSAATVEAALQELYQSAKTTTATCRIPICNSWIAAGTPLAAFVNGTSTTPGVTVANSKAFCVRWNNDAAPAALYTVFELPDDIDTSANATIEVFASKTGATIGDATTFDVELYNQAVGALHDADTNYGGTTSAMTGDATAKTVQKVTLTITAADLPAIGYPISFSIKPTAGLLGTDDLCLHAVHLKYKRKVKTS